MMWPHPMTCTACRATWVRMPAGADARRMEIGMLIICEYCGHLMVMRPGWHLADLTRAEVETVRAHWNYANVRRMQDQVTRKHWG